jgi:hypothetical protein
MDYSFQAFKKQAKEKMDRVILKPAHLLMFLEKLQQEFLSVGFLLTVGNAVPLFTATCTDRTTGTTPRSERAAGKREVTR